jgi:DHA1 family bicyclomycin/chloramphenicol resistance-like MFS transporter
VTTSRNAAAAARRIILSSALIGALSSFAMNAIVPALPQIQRHFAASIETTQLIVSGGFLALALGNLLVAPLSDRLGRKPVVLTGVVAFAIASIVAMLATHIAVVIGARIVQAFGIGAGAAVARAALNDHFGPEGAATGIAWTAMTILFVPLVAPSIGGFATDAWGWRSPFGLAAAFGLAATLFVWLRTVETRGGSTEGLAPSPAAAAAAAPAYGMLRTYALLLAEPRFRAFALFGACLLCAVYAFVTGAPYVAQELLGLSASEYGLWAGVPAAASLLGFAVAARVSRRVGAARMLTAGTSISLVGATTLLASVALLPAQPLALFLPAAIVSFAQSISLPNALAGALGIRPGAAGAASGLMGFLQLALSALVAQGIAVFGGNSAWPIAIAVLGATLCAAVAYARLRAHGALSVR